MKNRFSSRKFQEYIETYGRIHKDLAARLYTSHLIGRESELTLHGGGNTSVKIKGKNPAGDPQDILWIKGTGSDLADVKPENFVALKLDPLKKLRRVDDMSDREMLAQFRLNKLDPASPDPSVESLLHAWLPYKYVDHSHPDMLLVLTNQRRARAILKEALGEKIVVIPYAMSGFPLAQALIQAFEKKPDAEAAVILNHGIFTFADDVSTSYQLMIKYVRKADDYIRRRRRTAWLIKGKTDVLRKAIREVFNRALGERKWRPWHIDVRNSPDIVQISLSDKADEICRRGPLTPYHAIWIKHKAARLSRVPEDKEALKEEIQKAAELYQKDRKQYFQRQMDIKGIEIQSPDSLPRVFLAAGVGVIAIGLSHREASIAGDIAEHTFRAQNLAVSWDDYLPISESHVFDMETWKLHR